MAAEQGRHVMVLGLQIQDDALYTRYREGMMLILARFGGGFDFDLEVSRVLKTPGSAPINRVFSLFFADRAASAAFFADSGYRAVRAACFEPSVSATTLLAEYDEPAR